MIPRLPLPRLPFTPRPYQEEAFYDGMNLATSQPNKWHGFICPTGTGKSIYLLMWLHRIPNSVLITPRVEIISGMLDKLKIYPNTMDELIQTAGNYGIFTPIRFRNILARGELSYIPSVCLLDECHHAEADSWKDIDMYLNGCTVIGTSASWFRGTPKGTQEFRERWDTVKQVLTLKDALANNYCTMPVPSMWPLIDDDLIDIVNGELKVSTCNEMIADNINLIVERSKQFYSTRGKVWDRPTMYSVPSRDTAYMLADALTQSKLPAHAITQDTSRVDRAKIFHWTVNQDVALVQIDVVSEGVDLPIRRLIDIRPTMSPVKWLQQIGRIMRPTDMPPEYICVCRNLERHGYLMEGMLPSSAIKEAQEAFTDDKGIPQYSKRSGSRALGLEGLGRFIKTPIHMLNGLTAFAYNLISMDGYTRREYFALIHPNELQPLYAIRESTIKRTSEE